MVALDGAHLVSEFRLSEIPTEFCSTLDGWKFTYLFWIPLMVSEIIFFSLSLFKGYQCYYKDGADQFGYSGIRSMSVLIRDSILYFLAWVLFKLLSFWISLTGHSIFAVYLICMIFWVVPDVSTEKSSANVLCVFNFICSVVSRLCRSISIPHCLWLSLNVSYSISVHIVRNRQVFWAIWRTWVLGLEEIAFWWIWRRVHLISRIVSTRLRCTIFKSSLGLVSKNSNRLLTRSAWITSGTRKTRSRRRII